MVSLVSSIAYSKTADASHCNGDHGDQIETVSSLTNSMAQLKAMCVGNVPVNWIKIVIDSLLHESNIVVDVIKQGELQFLIVLNELRLF